MSSVLGVRFTGPLEPYAAGFAAELAGLGYTRNSVKARLFVMAHLSRWLAGRRLDAATLASRELVEKFFAVRRASSYTNYRTAKTLQPLLGYLRAVGVVGPPAALEPTPREVLLERYRRYLIGERGLASGTARAYSDAVRPFVAARETDGELDLEHLTAGEVTGFVLDACRDRSQRSGKMTVTALRSLLNFLHLDGVLAAPLVAAVPSAASWRLARLPKALDPGDPARLLASCDRRTTTGRRDFAILMLLIRLGLRAGEVARLELGDIDWRAGEFVVRGKGDRHERLPLPMTSATLWSATSSAGGPPPRRTVECSCGPERRMGA